MRETPCNQVEVQGLIPEPEQSEVFKIFKQGSAAPNNGGTGIGLGVRRDRQ